MILACGWSNPEGFISMCLLRTRRYFSGPEVEPQTLGHKNSPHLSSAVKTRGLNWYGCTRMVCLSLDQCPDASCMRVTLKGTVYMQLQARP